jgi:hypothetical protein
MFTFLRILINWSKLVLKTVIEVMEVVDTLVCDWECIPKTSVNDGTICIPTTSKIWDIVIMFCNFLCHAYTYNGVGISYSVAREVLSTREQFKVLQEQYPETDLEKRYLTYCRNRCLTKEEDVYSTVFNKLVELKCTADVNRLLTVQRTYSHPVYGARCGDTTLSEIVLDAKITIFDLSSIMVQVFDLDEDEEASRTSSYK